MDQTGETILLVEDNPDDASLTLRALGRNNIQNPIVVTRAILYKFGKRATMLQPGNPRSTMVS